MKNKTQTTHALPAYLPVKTFYSEITGRESPYQCQFSFAPLLEKLSANKAAQPTKLSKKIEGFLTKMESIIKLGMEKNDLDAGREELEELIPFLFPNLFLTEKKGFLKIPFADSFFYLTKELKALLDSEDWEIKTPDFFYKKENKTSVSMDISHLVLRFFYGVDIQGKAKEILVFRNKTTGLKKFYKVEIISDFVKATALKPLKKLDDELLFQLIDNFDDVDLWQKHLPPENFSFEGFMIGHLMDVTETQVMEIIKEKMFSEDMEANHFELLQDMEQLTGSFLNMPGLRIGLLRTNWSVWQENTSWALLRKFDKAVMFPSFEDEKGSYGRLIKSQKMVIVTDLTKQQHLCKIEEELVEMGYRSLMIVPFFDKKQILSGIFEITSLTPFAFNRLTFLKLRELIQVFGQGTNKFLEILDYHERQTMQSEFTSIHPSVEWRFREVASKLFWERAIEGQNVEIEPIVFNGLYPLYAQADIVGSSTLRNQTIQTDLKENLARALEILKICRKKVDFHLLDTYLLAAKKSLEHLEAGLFISSDETSITELITQEIHPLLRELQLQFPELPQKKLDAYFKHIHPHLDIVYQRRKAYDESVSQLNQMIGQYLDEADEKMQKILPHHFEKFTTDGVEYNIYLGNSILQNGGFSHFFLKNFRLWQLIKMCEITRLVAEKGQQLPIPLQTAQLVFVYNSTLSIRFKMEEKHFDVDGTYNVRYEILKKRIDKAIVKGTGERLTVAGKVAIVWLQEKDRQEYLQYLEHLEQKGYLKGEIEILELEKLQGAEGLRALRFEVKV